MSSLADWISALALDAPSHVPGAVLVRPRPLRRPVIVVGLGPDGLAESAAALAAGRDVIALDPNPDVAAELRRGHWAGVGGDVAARLVDGLRTGRFVPVSDFSAVEGHALVVVTRPLVRLGTRPDHALGWTAQRLAPRLTRGVHLEVDPSAVPTAGLFRTFVRIVEAGSGLVAGRDFEVRVRARKVLPVRVPVVPPRIPLPRPAPVRMPAPVVGGVPAPRVAPVVAAGPSAPSRTDRPTSDPSVDTPSLVTTVTVLVPAHNEETGIADTIEALLGQESPEWLRIGSIVVVVNNSTDRTAEIARGYPVTVVEMVDNPHKKSGALNHGWLRHVAESDLVLTMDADTVLRPDTVASMADELRGNPVLGAVCARYWTTPGRGLVWRLQRLEYSRYDDLRELRGWRVSVASGAAAMYRQAALLQVAEFRQRREPWDNDSLIEDYALTLDLKIRGWRVGAARNAHVYTTPPSTVRELWQQRMRWGRGGMDECLKRGWVPATRSDILSYGLFSLSVLFRFLFLAMVALMLIYSVPLRYALIGLIPVAVMWVERVTSMWRLPGRTGRDVALAAVLVVEDVYGFFLEACAVVAAWKCLFARGQRW